LGFYCLGEVGEGKRKAKRGEKGKEEKERKAEKRKKEMRRGKHARPPIHISVYTAASTESA